MSKSLGNIVDPLDAAEALRPGSAAALSHQGDAVRRRRRLHVGTVRGEVQRRPGEQPGQPGEPRGGDERALPAGAAAGAASGGPLAAVAAEHVAAYRDGDGRLALHDGAAAAFRLVSAANEFIAETQPWALAKDPAQADRLTGVLADVGGGRAHRRACCCCRSCRRRPRRSCGAWAMRGPWTSGASTPTPPGARRARQQILNAGALWPRIEDKGVSDRD